MHCRDLKKQTSTYARTHAGQEQSTQHKEARQASCWKTEVRCTSKEEPEEEQEGITEAKRWPPQRHWQPAEQSPVGWSETEVVSGGTGVLGPRVVISNHVARLDAPAVPPPGPLSRSHSRALHHCCYNRDIDLICGCDYFLFLLLCLQLPSAHSRLLRSSSYCQLACNRVSSNRVLKS